MITSATPEDIEYFGRMVQYSPSQNARGIKLVKNNVICAMTGYDNWTPRSVQMHIYIPDKKAFSRQFTQQSFIYPFLQVGRELAIAVVPEDNEESMEFTRRIGFVEKYRIKDGWDLGVDMVLHEMHKRDCIWLPRRGRLSSTGAPGPTSHSPRMANG